MDKILEINSTLLALTGFSLITLFVKILNTLTKIYQTNQLRNENLEKAVQSLLRDKILTNITEYMKSGYITSNQMESLNSMKEIYNTIGGNSFVDDLYNRSLKLPIRKDRNYETKYEIKQ